jgi:hypothetical protein
LIRSLSGYRLASLVPILVFVLAILIGGWLNGVEMHGRVVDDTTSEPVGTAGPAKISHGARTMTADPSTGVFTFPDLPRESKVGVDAPGYLRTGVPPTQEEIRLSPLSFTVYVNAAGDPTKHIAGADIRQGTNSFGVTTAGGNLVVSPYPGKDAKLLICAKGYDQKEISVHGVLGTFELTPGTNECPPLPTPTPLPSPSPSASPGASPSATPTPSPTASP